MAGMLGGADCLQFRQKLLEADESAVAPKRWGAKTVDAFNGEKGSMRQGWLVVLVSFFLGACQTYAPRIAPSTLSISRVTPESLLEHVRILASNDFAGREPGTPGEDQTVAYIERQFRFASLAPQASSSYRQQVPIMQRSANGEVTIVDKSSGFSLRPNVDFTVQLSRNVLNVDRVPIVFAGYGIIAPEFGRDDYAGVDVRNKIVVVLAGEPDEMFDPARAKIGSDAATAFAQAKRSYHRWDWMKQRNALIRGAKGIVIVVSDARLASKSQYFQRDYMLPSDSPPWAPPLSVMLSQSAFDRVAKAAGTSVEKWQISARSSNFQAIPVDLRLKGKFSATKRTFASQNVVGRVRGLGKGCVIVTAHWDGYGTDRSATGDNIWNGAVDDAGGVAQLIEIARRLNATRRPRRSVYFVATTGEERGFLGARHFLSHAPCPKSEIAAVINLDWFWELGRTRQFASHGLGYTSLDPVVQKLANAQGRSTTATNAYLAGGDQLPFLFAGIPGFHGGSSGALIDRPQGFEDKYGAMISEGAILREGNSNRDEVRDEWDLSGAVQDTELLADLAYELANAPNAPCWTAPSQFALKARMCR